MSGRAPREIGLRGEDEAVRYLVSCGYTVVGRNYRVRGGEIDIIARTADELVFIEVKTRSQGTSGYPEERVDFIKMRSLARAIREYMRRFHIPETCYIRVDIIACDYDIRDDTCTIRHIKNLELPA